MQNILYLQIQEEMKSALRAQDKLRLGTIRLLLAAIKQHEIDEQTTLDDTQILAIIAKMIKQRHDAIKQYKQGKREDLVAKEEAEIAILKQYLPQPLTAEEITKIIKEAFTTTNATLIKDMAKVMAYIKPKVQGRADLGKISITVKSMLK